MEENPQHEARAALSVTAAQTWLWGEPRCADSWEEQMVTHRWPPRDPDASSLRPSRASVGGKWRGFASPTEHNGEPKAPQQVKKICAER